MNKDEKWIQYAALISNQLSEMFNEDCSNHIDIEDLENSDNATAFIHALANVVPASIYNKLTSDDKNYLEFNHLANQLCFQFSKYRNEEKQP